MKSKPLRFRRKLAELILKGQKDITWRLFDDKDLKVGDKLEMIVWEDDTKFCEVEIIDVWEKKLGDIDDKDFEGHEKFTNKTEMLATYREYYGDKVNFDSLVKVIKFKVVSV